MVTTVGFFDNKFKIGAVFPGQNNRPFFANLGNSNCSQRCPLKNPTVWKAIVFRSGLL